MKHKNTSPDYHPPLHAGYFYHVYNRTNNKELLFCEDHDRLYFLERIQIYLSPYVDIFAYCLLGNHFHILIQVKSVKDIATVIENVNDRERTIAQKTFLELNPYVRPVEKIMESQFLRFFTSYSMYFNARYQRQGNLFTRRFKRILVEDDSYLLRLVYYIHANPVKHGLVNDFRTYQWSSYHSILSKDPSSLQREAVLNWFEGKESFLEFHQQESDYDEELKNYLIEE